MCKTPMRLTCLAAFFCGLAFSTTIGLCRDDPDKPDYGQLMAGIQLHFGKWKNKRYHWKAVWRIVAPENSVLEITNGMTVLKDQKYLRHLTKVGDPKGFPELDISLSERIDFTINSELGSLLSFYRSKEILGRKTLDKSSRDLLHSPAWDSSSPWRGMLKPNQSLQDTLEQERGMPFFRLPPTSEFESKLPTNLTDAIRPSKANGNRFTYEKSLKSICPGILGLLLISRHQHYIECIAI